MLYSRFYCKKAPIHRIFLKQEILSPFMVICLCCCTTSLHQMWKHYTSIKASPSSLLGSCLIIPQTWEQRKSQNPDIRHHSSSHRVSRKPTSSATVQLFTATPSKPFSRSRKRLSFLKTLQIFILGTKD